MPAPRKIALFGGTFDPIHLGHIHLAELAKVALALDEVRFLPCRISPHKTGAPPADAADRTALLELATRDLDWACGDDRELRGPGPSFSYQTAAAMRGEFPEARLFWLMGGDQWDALPRWKHPERLAETVEFIVIARGKAPQPRPGYRMHAVPGSHPASSSAIRQAIARGEKDPPWLAPSVLSYIRENRLYLP